MRTTLPENGEPGGQKGVRLWRERPGTCWDLRGMPDPGKLVKRHRHGPILWMSVAGVAMYHKVIRMGDEKGPVDEMLGGAHSNHTPVAENYMIEAWGTSQAGSHGREDDNTGRECKGMLDQLYVTPGVRW